MKIFYFRKNSFIWGIILIIIILALIILIRMVNSGLSSLEAESTFMVVDNLLK